MDTKDRNTEKKTQKEKGRGFFYGLKTEWKKISWKDAPDVAKGTAAVLCAAAALGMCIAGVDSVLLFLEGLLI